MSLNLNDGDAGQRKSVDRPLPKAGVQPARVAQIVDLGIQARAPFKGKEKSPVPQVFINLELVTDEFEIEGKKVKHRLAPKNFNIVSRKSEMYGNSAIAGFLSAIDPKDSAGGDLTKLVDQPCLATVVHVKGVGKHEGKTFANITQVMQPPEGYPVPALSEAPVVFSFSNPTVEGWKALPQFIQERIKSALNYKGSKVEEVVAQADGIGG